jgi:hypothetical protein
MPRLVLSAPVWLPLGLLSAAWPAAAQPALNPNLSISAPAASPVQQQMRENYRTQLQQVQRELLQQNPSGLGREQIEIQHQLDLYNSAPRQ